MSYKLITLDLDDTLLNKQHQLSAETITTIKALKKEGLLINIATGRMLVSALPYIQQLELTGPMITYNGAYIKDLDKDQVILEKPIEEELVLQLIDFCHEQGLHLNLYQNDQLYVQKRNSESEYYEQVAGIKANVVGPFKQFLTGSVTKLLVIEFDRQKQQHFYQVLSERFSSLVNVTDSKKSYIEIINHEVSKGKALQEVAQLLGVKKQETVAIGDGRNDLSMIEWAGLGIAMADAPDDVKKSADMIAPPHDQDGVARVLKEIFAL